MFRPLPVAECSFHSPPEQWFFICSVNKNIFCWWFSTKLVLCVWLSNTMRLLFDFIHSHKHPLISKKWVILQTSTAKILSVQFRLSSYARTQVVLVSIWSLHTLTQPPNRNTVPLFDEFWLVNRMHIAYNICSVRIIVFTIISSWDFDCATHKFGERWDVLIIHFVKIVFVCIKFILTNDKIQNYARKPFFFLVQLWNRKNVVRFWISYERLCRWNVYS